MAKKRIIILGAGLAGLSAAWHLQKGGKDCLVFEKEKEIGGLCSSKKIGGFTFDCDGHLLHFRHSYTFNLVKELLKGNLAEHQRNACIYFDGKFVRYPFQANLYGLASCVIKDCLLGIAQRLKDSRVRKNLNFLEWINRTFGSGIAKYFMIPYNTKFWRMPPRELTCEWLDGFIPVPLLKEVIKGALEENKKEFGYNARFWYPKIGGINNLPLVLGKSIKNVYTNCPVLEINFEKKEIKTAYGEKEKYDYLISTIPLPEIPRLIAGGVPKNVFSAFEKLRWNSIFNLNLGIEKKNGSKHWIYFPQKELCFFRIGFPHNFSSSLAPQGTGSLYIEVSYSKEKPIDKSNIISCIKKDLKKTGILSFGDRILVEDINDIKYGYPIYDKNYAPSRKDIFKFLLKNNIIPCGRYGSWRYISMEGALLDGKRVADSL